MSNLNFIVPLHKACSTGGGKGVSPTLRSVFFQQGYAYATNGSIIAKHPLHLSTIQDPGEHLNGKGIPRESYEQILTFDIAEVSYEGINCKSEDGERTAFFEFTKLPVDYKQPDFKSFIKNLVKSPKSIEFISVDPKHLEIATKCLVGGQMGIKLQFHGVDRGIIVTPFVTDIDDEQMVIVMPRIIEPSLFEGNDKPST